MKKAVLVSFATVLASVPAFAEDVAAHTAAVGDRGLVAIGLALLLGLGVLSATSAQGKVGAAAMEGLARNPQARNALFVPMIVVLALIESLFILTWLVANGIAPKI